MSDALSTVDRPSAIEALEHIADAFAGVQPSALHIGFASMGAGPSATRDPAEERVVVLARAYTKARAHGSSAETTWALGELVAAAGALSVEGA